MRSIFILLLSAITLRGFAQSLDHQLPLDLTWSEYRQLLDKTQKLKGPDWEIGLDSATKESITAGEKLYQWIALINQARPEAPVRISDPTLRRGIPIDSPNLYGPKITAVELLKLKESLPSALLDVLFGQSSPGPKLPVEEKEFIKNAREVVKLYESAVRWATIMKPNLTWFRHYRYRDLRSFYMMKKIPNLDQLLKNIKQLPQDEQKLYLGYIKDLCLNSQTLNLYCQNELRWAWDRNFLVEYKNKYWPKAQALWNSFFFIDNPRHDVIWNAKDSAHMVVPFIDPENQKIADFLKVNIEDEFKINNWNLLVDFTSNQVGAPYLIFKPGQTPHVTSGNIIVMDANQDIEEYAVKWIIRHEYGHILRLPDCYIEFYDSEQEVAINYQLDTSDLMCSRAGNFNQRIYDELKRVYFRP